MTKYKQLEPEMQAVADEYYSLWLKLRDADAEGKKGIGKLMDKALSAVPPDDQNTIVFQAQRMAHRGLADPMAQPELEKPKKSKAVKAPPAGRNGKPATKTRQSKKN